MSITKRPTAVAPKGAKVVRGVRGFGTVNTNTQPIWQECREAFIQVAQGYGCHAIELPLVELPSLYHRAWSKDEPAQSWLMAVQNDGGDTMILRPTVRESIVRSAVETAGDVVPPLQKAYYWAPVFRANSPASGEAIQQWQYGVEVIGDADPIVDAQCIIIAWRLLQVLRISANVQINSIGCANCRPIYLRALGDYIKSQRHNLGEAVSSFSRTPWRLFTSTEAAIQAVAEQAPQSVDYLCPACNNHLVQVLEYLDEVEIPYELNSRVMPEWEYASRTVFSLSTGGGELPRVVLINGCRYDDLLPRLGGVGGSAVGFSASVETLVQQVSLLTAGAVRHAPHVLLAQLGPEARKHAIVLFEQLRAANILVVATLGSGGLKMQLEEAGRLGVRYAAIIGQREILDGTVLLRDMENGIQEIIDRERLVIELAKRLTREAAV
jgi:histidyl-tRNA synthetase